jgi:TatD DNase family protein
MLAPIMMLFTDTHAHLSMVGERLGRAALDALLADYGEAWRASLAEGAPGPLVVDAGTEADDLPRRRLFVGEKPFLRFAAGIWPSHSALIQPKARLAVLESTIASDRVGVSALGECGLDYHHSEGTPEAQRELFAAQIAMAQRFGLPLIVHSRDAAADSLDILQAERPTIPVIIHCFSYGPAELRKFLDLGCFISFAGNLSYKGSAPLRQACALVPENRLLLETDAPYMNPEPARGRPSCPRDVERSYLIAAELRGVKVEELAARVCASAHALFG